MFDKLRQKVKHRKLIKEFEENELQFEAERIKVMNGLNVFVNSEGTKVFIEWIELQVELLRDKLELLSRLGKSDELVFASAKLEVYREIIEQINSVIEAQHFAQYEVEDSQPSYINSPV